MFLANFVKIDIVKLKKNRELGILILGIKRDGHKKKSGNQEFRELEVLGIRRNDCRRCLFISLMNTKLFEIGLRKVRYVKLMYTPQSIKLWCKQKPLAIALFQIADIDRPGYLSQSDTILRESRKDNTSESSFNFSYSFAFWKLFRAFKSCWS